MAALLAATGTVAAQDTADWSGFYAGVYAGYGADRQDESNSATGIMETGDGYSIDYESHAELSNPGNFIGEVRAGYNYQLDALVFGLEGSLGTGGLSKQTSTYNDLTYNDLEGEDNGVAVIIENTRKMDIGAIGTATGKIGYATGDWLFYGKGGLAVTHASTSLTLEGEYSTDNNTPVPLGTSGSTDGLLFGSTFAVGAETRLNEQLSIGGELGVTSFGLQDVSLAPFLGGGVELPGPPIAPAQVEDLKAWHILSAKVGVNYRF